MPDAGISIDTNTIVLQLLRWLHFFAGITWIGLLYFFNFINGPFQAKLDPAVKKAVVPELMPRALWWFRWGAMVTFLSGWFYIYWKNWVATDAGMRGPGGLFTSTWGQWITSGALFGTIMWFNVWFIIWPAQKKIIAGVKSGQAAPPELAKRALLASRTNTFLSVPLLFFMAGASHFPTFGFVPWVLVVAVGFAVVWLAIKISSKTGTSI